MNSRRVGISLSRNGGARGAGAFRSALNFRKMNRTVATRRAHIPLREVSPDRERRTYWDPEVHLAIGRHLVDLSVPAASVGRRTTRRMVAIGRDRAAGLCTEGRRSVRSPLISLASPSVANYSTGLRTCRSSPTASPPPRPDCPNSWPPAEAWSAAYCIGGKWGRWRRRSERERRG